jgi:hypothetical protein
MSRLDQTTNRPIVYQVTVSIASLRALEFISGTHQRNLQSSQVEIINQSVVTVIFLGFRASALGSFRVSTPCFMFASILDWSMALPNVNSRK